MQPASCASWVILCWHFVLCIINSNLPLPSLLSRCICSWQRRPKMDYDVTRPAALALLGAIPLSYIVLLFLRHTAGDQHTQLKRRIGQLQQAGFSRKDIAHKLVTSSATHCMPYWLGRLLPSSTRPSRTLICLTRLPQSNCSCRKLVKSASRVHCYSAGCWYSDNVFVTS